MGSMARENERAQRWTPARLRSVASEGGEASAQALLGKVNGTRRPRCGQLPLSDDLAAVAVPRVFAEGV